jgi:hypothetical protein
VSASNVEARVGRIAANGARNNATRTETITYFIHVETVVNKKILSNFLAVSLVFFARD